MLAHELSACPPGGRKAGFGKFRVIFGVEKIGAPRLLKRGEKNIFQAKIKNKNWESHFLAYGEDI